MIIPSALRARAGRVPPIDVEVDSRSASRCGRVRVLFCCRAALLLMTTLWVPSPLPAATLGVCVQYCEFDTLAEAVAAAADGDTIELRRNEPHLASGLVIERSITIRGVPGEQALVIAAATTASATDRIASVVVGVSVTLQGFSLAHGHVQQYQRGGALHIAAGATARLVDMVVRSSEAYQGGGIYNAGTLELIASTVGGNTASYAGGGIFNAGTAVLAGSTVAFNSAPVADSRGGGGVYNDVGADLLATRTAFESNSAEWEGGNLSTSGRASLRSSRVLGGNASYGGGIHHGGGQLVIDDTDIGASALDGNQARSGGALYVQSGEVLVRNSTIAYATALSQGGGLYISGGSVRIESSTIHANTANDGAGIIACSPAGVSLVNSTVSGNVAIGHGGGLYVCSDTVLTLANATIANNIADADEMDGGSGGGVFAMPSARVALQNTILDDNEDRTPGTYADRGPDCFGTLDSAGHNLIGSLGFSLVGSGGTACRLIGDATGNGVPADARLYVLSGGSGPTRTHGLMADSPARDAGDPAGCVDFELAALKRDQRGYLRDQACDIGAYEYAGTPPDPLFSSGFEVGE